MQQASASGAKFLPISSSQAYSNHTQNNLVSGLNHAPNLVDILLRVGCELLYNEFPWYHRFLLPFAGAILCLVSYETG